jgi:hypothetical protein
MFVELLQKLLYLAKFLFKNALVKLLETLFSVSKWFFKNRGYYLRHKLERNIYFFVHAYASMMELQSLLKKKLIRQVAETESLIKPHCHFAVSTASSRSNAFCSFMYDYLRKRGPTSSFNVNLLPFIFIGFSLRAIKQWNE